LVDDNFTANSAIHELAAIEDPAWNAKRVLPPKLPAGNGKEKIDNAAFGMKEDTHPSNTTIRRCHSSS
jgi:hypothetical protein